MKVFAVLAFTLLLGACSSTEKTVEHEASEKTHDETFRMAMQISCEIKYPNAKEICACKTDVIVEATPLELQKTITSDPQAKNKIARIMINNTDKIEACERN